MHPSSCFSRGFDGVGILCRCKGSPPEGLSMMKATMFRVTTATGVATWREMTTDLKVTVTAIVSIRSKIYGRWRDGFRGHNPGTSFLHLGYEILMSSQSD